MRGGTATAVNDGVDPANAIHAVFVDAVDNINHARLFAEARGGVDFGEQAAEFTILFGHPVDIAVQLVGVEVFIFSKREVFGEG